MIVALVTVGVVATFFLGWRIGYDQGFEDGAIDFMRELKAVRDEYRGRR